MSVVVGLAQPRSAPARAAALAGILARDQDVRRATAAFLRTLVIAEEQAAVEALAVALYGPAWREGL